MASAVLNSRLTKLARRWSLIAVGFSVALAISTSVIGEGAAFAWTTPTTVTFTSTNYTVNASSNWTFGFSLWSGTGLSNGNTINATFPAGFNVPSNPSVILGSAFGSHYCKIGTISVTHANSTTLAPTISVKLAGTGQGNNCAGTYWPGTTTWTVDGVTNPANASSTVIGYTQYNTVEPDAGTVNSPVTIVPTTPGPVATFAATNHANNQSVLSWTPPINTGGSPIIGYSVTSSPVVSPPASCTNTINLSCTFTNLTDGTPYQFTITAKNAAGSGTPSSTSATPALAPTIGSVGVTATPQVGQQLTAATAGVTGSPTPTLAYQWYDDNTPIGGANSSTYTPQTSDYGNTLTVKVTATNIAGSASATSPTTAIVAGVAPTIAPAVITGEPQIGETLTALPSAVSGFPTPSLTYQWNLNGNGIIGATSSTYTMQPGDFGGLITVTETAHNVVGSASSTSSPAVTVTGVVPGAPTDVTGTPDNGVAFGTYSSVSVSWVAPSNVGLPVGTLTYTISYSSDHGAIWTTATTGVTGTSYDVTGLDSGVNYSFEVTASNAAGPGLPGTSISEVAPYTVPATILTIGDSVSDETLTVTWTDPSDGNSMISGYDVLIWGTAYYVPGANATSATFSYPVVQYGEWYQPVVTAINASGAGVYSAQAPTVFPGFAPEAPTSISVSKVGPGTVNVQWSFSVTSSGNGGWEVNDYVLTVTDLQNDTSQTITTSSGHVHLLTVTGLTPGVPYSFSVIAVATNGSSGPESTTFTLS